MTEPERFPIPYNSAPRPWVAFKVDRWVVILFVLILATCAAVAWMMWPKPQLAYEDRPAAAPVYATASSNLFHFADCARVDTTRMNRVGTAGEMAATLDKPDAKYFPCPDCAQVEKAADGSKSFIRLYYGKP